MDVAYNATLEIPIIIDFARPDEKSGPNSLYDIIIVEIIIAGKTENIPLKIGPIFDNNIAIVIIIPASTPLNIIFLIS